MGKYSTTKEFADRATEIHDGKYSYKRVIYSHSHIKVEIVCPEHGSFWQMPYVHLRGAGCPACTSGGFTSNIGGKVYVLQSDNMIKIGVTNRDVEERLLQINRSCAEEFHVAYSAEMIGNIALKVERSLIRWLRREYEQPSDKFDGYKECFITNDDCLGKIVRKLLELEARYVI